ncbi:MAG: helix-turn-helix domain-containing protein [Nitrososphaerota archaeon]|nr:helix-turn-helix domain-containing protein [Nitrososphaerota archaeon]
MFREEVGLPPETSNIDSEDELVWLLRQKTRRKIILAIGDSGKVSATSLRDALKISTGSLYYNLRQLKDFVTQDQDRNYVLTEEGEKVYKILKEGGVLSPEIFKPKPPSKLTSILNDIFFPIWLFSPIYQNTGLRIIVSTLSILVSLTLMTYSRTAPLILHIYSSQPNIIEIAAKYFFNIFILYILITLISIIFSGKLFHMREEKLLDRIRDVAWSSLEDELKFVLALFIAVLPMIFYPSIIAIDRFFQLSLIPKPGEPGYYQIRDLYMTIAQVLTLPFMVALTAFGRRLSSTSAALVVLIVYFSSHVVSQLLIIGL